MFEVLNINEILNEKNTAAIIMYLYLFGAKTRTEIYNAISTNPRMPQKLEKLLEQKIIKYTAENSKDGTRVELTSMGMKIGEMLCRMERLVGGDPESYKWDGFIRSLDHFGRTDIKSY